MSGLTSRDAWTLQHITRCPSCGTWELITETERTFRELGIHARPALCKHHNPSQEEDAA